MSPLEALPLSPLSPGTPLGRAFLEHGVGTIRAAAEYLHALPYGRTTDPRRFELVLAEGRGTCSGKHALMAALCDEHGIRVDLMLALFEMDGVNTPAVATTLRRHGLDAVPEAHCYLAVGEIRLDLTHPGAEPVCTLDLLVERVISPDQVGSFKIAWHRERMAEWCARRNLDIHGVWAAREECIAALSASQSNRSDPTVAQAQ